MVFTVLFSLTHTLYIVFYIIPESYALLCGCWGIPSYSRLSCNVCSIPNGVRSTMKKFSYPFKPRSTSVFACGC